jgi:hypothetical protein
VNNGDGNTMTRLATHKDKVLDKFNAKELMTFVTETFRFSPQNFRHVYWIYVMLAAMTVILFPSVHTLFYLPWAFYFANEATHVVTWDRELPGKKMGEVMM